MTDMADTTKPTLNFLTPADVTEAHKAIVAMTGTTYAEPDPDKLAGALARPYNLSMYEPGVTLAELAAMYLLGIAKSHAFVDGNKRAAVAACELFVRQNKYDMSDVTDDELYEAVLAFAAGDVWDFQTVIEERMTEIPADAEPLTFDVILERRAELYKRLAAT